MARRRNSSDYRDLSVEAMVRDIHAKLDGVGFEALIENVENIEKTQTEMLREMEKISTVIYEPDEGLFARVRNVEANHREQFGPLRSDVESLVRWRSEVQAKDGPLAQLDQARRDVAGIVDVRRKLTAYAVTAIGSSLLVLLKAAWDFFSAHITLK